jgi:hypothetical protein
VGGVREGIPPSAQRLTRRVEPTRQSPELYVNAGTQLRHLTNGRNPVQPGKKGEIRQQCMI